MHSFLFILISLIPFSIISFIIYLEKRGSKHIKTKTYPKDENSKEIDEWKEQNKLVYGYNGELDKLRETEFEKLKGETYLDFAGSSIATKSMLQSSFEYLDKNLLGNPHSANPSSKVKISDFFFHTKIFFVFFLIQIFIRIEINNNDRENKKPNIELF